MIFGSTYEIRYVNNHGLHPMDWAVIALYIMIILGQGLFYSKKQKGNSEFFTAGSMPLGPLSVGISIFATLLSTISYLGKPGEMISKGPILIFAQILSVPFVYYIVSYIFLPTIMKRRVTSVYEFLEDRVGLLGRLCGAALFIILRLVWMALMIYLTSMALAVVTGVGLKWVGLISVAVGCISIAYSTMGGIRAVVKTDVLQATLLFIGAFVTIFVVTWHTRGFSWIPLEWNKNWDVQPFISFDPYVRVSVIGSIVHMVLWRVATFCTDQTAVQRYMTLSDLSSAKRSVFIASLTTIVSTLILVFVGFALLGFFTQFENAIPPEMNLQKDADQIFPYFIAHYLPVGISGLVVAAFLAAAMSSIDSGVSSITAVLNTDFLDRLSGRKTAAIQGVAKVRLLAVFIGIVAICLGYLVRHIPGNILEIVNKSSNLVTVPIFSLFVMAWFFHKVTPLGALMGTLSGIIIGILVGFWDVLTGGPRISFLYMGIASLVGSLLVGYILSHIGPGREEKRQCKIWAVCSFCILLVAFISLVYYGRISY